MTTDPQFLEDQHGYKWSLNFAGTNSVTFEQAVDSGYADDISNELFEFSLEITPVPEPSSTALLGLAAFSCIIRRRR